MGMAPRLHLCEKTWFSEVASYSEHIKVYHVASPTLSTNVWNFVGTVRIWWSYGESHECSNQSIKQHMPVDQTGQGWLRMSKVCEIEIKEMSALTTGIKVSF